VVAARISRGLALTGREICTHAACNVRITPASSVHLLDEDRDLARVKLWNVLRNPVLGEPAGEHKQGRRACQPGRVRLGSKTRPFIGTTPLLACLNRCGSPRFGSPLGGLFGRDPSLLRGSSAVSDGHWPHDHEQPRAEDREYGDVPKADERVVPVLPDVVAVHQLMPCRGQAQGVTEQRQRPHHRDDNDRENDQKSDTPSSL
jgi:hypothetical protein